MNTIDLSKQPMKGSAYWADNWQQDFQLKGMAKENLLSYTRSQAQFMVLL